MHLLNSHDAWLHLANVLYLLAYSVRDILWLRILTVVAAGALMPYYFCCSEDPLYAPIAWNGLFIMVNVVQIALLIMERRPVFLGEDELRLYRTVFKTLKPREFVRLMRLASWERAVPGTRLLGQNEPVEALILVAHGTAAVDIDGRHIAHVQSNQFIGEMGFLTQQPASANVVAADVVEYLSWPVAKLRDFLDETPHLHVKVQGILGVDLVGKLRREGFANAHPSQVP